MWISLLKNWKLILSGITILASFYAGYVYSTYQYKSEALDNLLQEQSILKEYMERESEIASVVEERLSTLSANERVLERERLKIVEKPVYNISCIDEQGKDIIRKYAEGQTKQDVEDG